MEARPHPYPARRVCHHVRCAYTRPTVRLEELLVSDDEEMKRELERLRAENESLKRRASKGASMKVSDKGGVSIYGLGRFPVTLYQEQWLKLLDMAEDIRAFIAENQEKLKKKE
jgi:hypothetical protein